MHSGYFIGRMFITAEDYKLLNFMPRPSWKRGFIPPCPGSMVTLVINIEYSLFHMHIPDDRILNIII